MRENGEIIITAFLVLIWLIPLYIITKKDPLQLELMPHEKKDLFNSFFWESAKKILTLKHRYFQFGAFSLEKCKKYEEKIMGKNFIKLRDLFKLNFEDIHEIIPKIIVTQSLIILIYIFEIFLFNYFLPLAGLDRIILLFEILKLGTKILIFVFFIELIYYCDSGDINKYLNFLKCPNVKESGFFKFKRVKYFQIFLILFILLYFLSECLYIKKKRDEGFL